MINNISTSRTGAAKEAAPQTPKQMQPTSKHCKAIRLPREIVLTGELGENDEGYVFNDAQGLMVDYNLDQTNVAALEPAKKVSADTLRRILYTWVPVISLINYKSSEEGQLNNPILFRSLMFDGRVMNEDLFEVATAERNTQQVSDLQTILLPQADSVYFTASTGVVIDSDQPQGTTVSVAMKVDEWIPYATYAARIFGA